jgi:hypothetical protein
MTLNFETKQNKNICVTGFTIEDGKETELTDFSGSVTDHRETTKRKFSQKQTKK